MANGEANFPRSDYMALFDGEDFEVKKEKVAPRGNTDNRFILREGPGKIVDISDHGTTIEDINISIDQTTWKKLTRCHANICENSSIASALPNYQLDAA